MEDLVLLGTLGRTFMRSLRTDRLEMDWPTYCLPFALLVTMYMIPIFVDVYKTKLILTHIVAFVVQPDEAIYSPGVTVFRAPERQGHTFLTDPFKLSVVACPGLYRPEVDPQGRLAAKHVQQLEQKLDLILKLASCFGHDSVVLGPLGCAGTLPLFAGRQKCKGLPCETE